MDLKKVARHFNPDYDLYRITETDLDVFERLVGQQISGLDEKLTELKTEVNRREREIVELYGEDAAAVGEV
jgi:hypothetical protein